MKTSQRVAGVINVHGLFMSSMACLARPKSCVYATDELPYLCKPRQASQLSLGNNSVGAGYLVGLSAV